MEVADYAESAAAIFSGGAGLGAGAFFAKWFFEWIGGRVDKREERVDKATQDLFDHMETQITRLTTRVESAEHALAACEKKHQETLEEVSRLKGLVAGLGDARQHAALIVAAEKQAKEE